MSKAIFRNTLGGTALLASGVLLGTTPAQAQLVLDGEVTFELAHNNDTSVNTKHIGGSFSGLVWNDFGLQLDLSVGKHEQYTSTQPAATLHLFHAPNEALTWGLFLAAEDRRPGNSYFWGAEVAWQSEGFGLEAFAAYRDDISASTDGTRFGLEASYRPDGADWTLFAGYAADDGAPLEQRYGYLGATYEIREGIALGLSAGRNDEGDTIASALVSFTFGDGSRLRARDTMELFPGARETETAPVITPP
ncbi:hypothetical protein [Oceanicola sp. S124]|uniref:hypothetical protein n=1 Tax=Oceanicola sp. S124 TaxID=1042378 RepID=UPI0002558980|nr:hypothetical protein [Oceanicola sp. S124]